MIPHRLPIAIVALLGLIAVLPVWTAIDLSEFTLTTTFMAGMVLPAVVILYVSSWVRPSLAAPILGLFILIGIVALLPTIFGFVQVATNMTDGLVQLTFQLALPILLVVFILTLAQGRFQ